MTERWRWVRAAMVAVAVAGCAGAPQSETAVSAIGAEGGSQGAHEASAAAPAVVLRGRIVDGTGAPPLEGGVVVLEGSTVRCVGAPAACPLPADARVIDAGGGTILPGLIDLHVHSRPHYLWMFLAAGVTSVRDLNGEFEMLEAMGRDGEGRTRIFWSGPLVDGGRSVIGRMGGRFHRADTPAEARAVVDSLADRGVDVIKLYEQIPPGAYAAAAARARERGIPTATDLGIQVTRGLTGAEVDALQAIEAGVGSIEHLSGFALAYRRLGGDPTRLPLDPVLVDTLARAVVRRGTAVVPTLVAYTHFASDTLPGRDILLSDRLPEGMAEFWTQMYGSQSAAQRERAVGDRELGRALVRRIHELGGRIGAGSDTPAGPFDVPGGGLHRELELLVDAGLTPLAAIHAATGEAGRILGRPELGTLAPGTTADLLVVEGDPSADIRATRNIRLVIKAGRIFPIDSLRAGSATDVATPQR